MVEVPIALVIVLPSVVMVLNRVSVEIGVEEAPEPPEPPAPPEPDSVALPVAVAVPEPELPAPPPDKVESPLADPAGPVAVPEAVRAEVAAREPETVEATTPQLVSTRDCFGCFEQEYLPEAQ